MGRGKYGYTLNGRRAGGKSGAAMRAEGGPVLAPNLTKKQKQAYREMDREDVKEVTLPRVRWLEGPDPSEYFK